MRYKLNVLNLFLETSQDIKEKLENNKQGKKDCNKWPSMFEKKNKENYNYNYDLN